MKWAILGLRWVLGIVVLLESLHFALSTGKLGLPRWAGPALGGSEAIAVLLFLTPAATVTGGWLLLFIFALAASIHLAASQFNVGGLLVYGMAVVVCMVYRGQEKSKVAHDG